MNPLGDKNSMPKLQSTNLTFLPKSLTILGGVEFGLAQLENGNRMAVLSDQAPVDFAGERSEFDGQVLTLCPLSPQNAAGLRHHLPWLQPRPLGLKTSAGMGDRIGLATPGHVRAVRAVSGDIAPIYAQQSIREMTRTERTPQQVMDDATWGLFAEGWQDVHGSDADHLMTTDNIDACLAAGFTLFTIDPGAHVQNQAETAGLTELRELAQELPEHLSVKASGLLGKTIEIEDLSLSFDEHTLLKAAVKYGKALAHVETMYHHLVHSTGERPFELEVSVDETEQPTSHAEHAYIASELKRLGIEWVSLAPRYIGRFEKGVDYIGDLEEFERDLKGHAAIARAFGPYKLSLHSGSDKFSVYPAAMRQTRGLVHLKTAGTSYLEALRTLAAFDPAFLREIYIFARERFGADKATYHVSAELSRAPLPEAVSDWPGILDQFDARQILHHTYGSVLTERNKSGGWVYRGRLMHFLVKNAEAYYANLEGHFIRHLLPFSDVKG
jgi:hypothetical protein